MADALFLSLLLWVAVVSLGLFWVLLSLGEVARLRWRRRALNRERRRQLACAHRLLAIRPSRSAGPQQPAAAQSALSAVPAADAGLDDRRRHDDSGASSSLTDDVASRLPIRQVIPPM
jgi:hypothetical protein